MKYSSVPRLVTFVVVTALGVCEGQYPGFDRDVQGSKANTELVIAEIRPKLFDDLSGAERQIYSQIHFEVSTESHAMQAYSSRDGITRRVTVTEAMGRAIKLNVDAFLIEKLYHKDNFLGEYMSYVCSRYQVNYPKYAQGQVPDRIKSPYEIANANVDELYSHADINKSRAQIEGGAFAFLLAHEVAHHILGHVDQPSHSKQEQRTREKAADDWAIDLVTRKGINPVTGIVPLLFSYYTTRDPVSAEVDRDHPADARRLLDMYEGLQGRLPQFRQEIVASGQKFDDVQKQVQIAIKTVRDEIAANE